MDTITNTTTDVTTTHYAAHLEGEFDTAEAALAKVGFLPAVIEQLIAHATVNGSPAVFAPCNPDYAAVVRPDGAGRWQLWRGYYGVTETETEARELIAEFEAAGTEGPWAVFEWTRPAVRAVH